MIISTRNIAIANDLVAFVQSTTETVSDGEGVAMSMLWLFLMQHAALMGLEPFELARQQLEAFLQDARSVIAIETGAPRAN